ncbi:hypothetical protein [Anabaena catenula]|uniref:Uncharacterized protein n=1 Tax=Anabaena catenula FACHB-362 TaxID=2692877 RepID=A0ABR8JAU6_9NOST|nr:hypothetical protein [Anabaena catenula]MBD2694655.1 hypothetical protein [Anabaena catenula FACHB-362]
MKLIKKSEKLVQETKINKETKKETKESNLQVDFVNNIEEVTGAEQPKVGIEYQEPNYIPLRDNPIVHSVGKTGWQVSDIWKDIRLDSF